MLREVQKAEQLKFSFLVSKINDLYILVVVLDFCSMSNIQNEALENILKHGAGGGGFIVHQAKHIAGQLILKISQNVLNL